MIAEHVAHCMIIVRPQLDQHIRSEHPFPHCTQRQVVCAVLCHLKIKILSSVEQLQIKHLMSLEVSECCFLCLSNLDL